MLNDIVNPGRVRPVALVLNLYSIHSSLDRKLHFRREGRCTTLIPPKKTPSSN